MNKPHFFSCKFVFVALSFFWSAQTLAVNINVDTGSYIGTWRVQGQTSEINGDAAIDVPAGSYSVIIGTVASFGITVDAGGIITTNNAGAATGSVNALSFNTSTVYIDPANLLLQTTGTTTARWGVSRVVKDVVTADNVELVNGLRYYVTVGSYGGFAINLAADGAISIENNVSANVNGNTVTFNTLQVSVDPGEFLNQVHGTNHARWGISRVIKDSTEAATVNLVPEIRYGFVSGTYGVFFVYVDAQGVVTVENGISALGGDKTISFNTITISIDPADFLLQVDGGATAQWGVSRVLAFATTAGNAIIVPGIRYGIVVGTFGVFYITADENGVVSIENGYSATGGQNSLTFNTESIVVDPGAYTGRWSIGRALENVYLQQVVNLVPGVRYRIANTAEFEFFTVHNPCAVSPLSVPFTDGTFTLSCGLPDGDQDGVPDASDNCPVDANSDQVDLDLDAIGDACDNDIDNDLIANLNDNCPSTSNNDQVDTDSDGLGDVCDGDNDGDSIADASDNCPLIANAGQGDSDDDGMGDACDIDDDNDLVADAADNCPLHFNPDQSDWNSNGLGDVCDSDVDGDGVLNITDACPLTPLNQSVTDNGCSGDQYVALTCAVDDFSNHGQYVRCVSQTTKQLVFDNVISSKERAVLVKGAAKDM